MPGINGLLKDITENALAAAARREKRISIGEMENALAGAAAKPLDFTGALSRRVFPIIAELKKSSPSAGSLRPVYDVKALAAGYASAGAAAISVLTEEKYFSGDLYHLIAAREGAPAIPLLRKDFLTQEYQICESRYFGADAILLIKRLLPKERFLALGRLAAGYGLGILAEAHDESSLDDILSSGLDCAVGVNSRDLETLEIKLAAASKLLAKIPASRVAVAESGIKNPADAASLKSARGDGPLAFLVGTLFMQSPDPGRKLEDFLRLAV